MTGRDLIIYILQHNLEDQEVVKDGVFIGFMSENEAAVKFGVAASTIRTWYIIGKLDGVKIGESLFFLRDVADPRKDVK